MGHLRTLGLAAITLTSATASGAVDAPLLGLSESPNQTSTVSPIQNGATLPFSLRLEQASFQLPVGLQGVTWGIVDGLWVLVAGRTTGIHGFSSDNFPPSGQNQFVYVVDPATGITVSKSWNDPSSGLSEEMLDSLTATNAQFVQQGPYLYLVGGYGLNSQTGGLDTKDTCTVLDLRGIKDWVFDQTGSLSAAPWIRQARHPSLRVAGGELRRAGPHDPFLLVFGANQRGDYNPGTSPTYSFRVQPFFILERGGCLQIYPLTPSTQPSFRRRDLNVPSVVRPHGRSFEHAFVALSGVFTPDTGAWTVPVFIGPQGDTCEPDPQDPETFKQGMNNYTCPHFTMFSRCSTSNYIVLMGGLSFLHLKDGKLVADVTIPFSNEISTIRISGCGGMEQFLMPTSYPVIPANFAHPGNPLFFGTSGEFIPSQGLPAVLDAAFDYDKLSKHTLLGYVVGGIASTLKSVSTRTDTEASPYIFTVTLIKKK